MESALMFGLSVTLFVGFFAAVVWAVHQQHKKFAASFAGDDDYACVPGGLMKMPEVTTRRAAQRARLKPAKTGGKHPKPLWHVWVDDIALGRRTTLTLATEGFLGGLRETLGFSDVQTGDAAFDGGYTLRGSDADVVRGVMSRADVKAATARLFAGGDVRACSLNKQGTLFVDLRRKRLEAGEARAVLARVRALGDALHAASMASALPEPIMGSVGSVSSSSGAPVGMRGR